MKKIISFYIALLVFEYGYSQNSSLHLSESNNLVFNITDLSVQQLFDTGNYYFEKNSNDTALVYYYLLINTISKSTDFEQQKRLIGTLSNTAAIYYYMCDYRSAYELLIKALCICEKTHYEPLTSLIYSNIGNIFFRFEKYDIAKLYYAKALNLCRNNTNKVVILNNMGASEVESNHLDSAFFWLNKSLEVSKQHNNVNLYSPLNSMASLYEKREIYDSALYYYRLSLSETRKNNSIEMEAQNLSDFGKLFYKLNRIDSALYYIDLSSDIAEKSKFIGILADNYLTLSKIEESKGQTKNAFIHYKKFVLLRDSVLNTDKFNEINQLQRLYEISITNQQIEELIIEQQNKERKILLQRIVWVSSSTILLLVSGLLLFVFLQKKRLNTAYKALFEKNIEIIKLQEKSPEKDLEKYKKSALSDIQQQELLNKILPFMEDSSIICDMEFSLDKLAELLQSNHTYVSQVINTALKKNFRSFLNSYRIREAQRLFSDFDISKYTIESIASQVGYKSATTFRDAFKEITGVSPNFYLKSVQEFKN
ncbi:MAG: AraC family transcriptional regulator [Bacteroidales bacterium]|nr:AraC family transcriptional regulator [Bacteroidales bacterium]